MVRVAWASSMEVVADYVKLGCRWDRSEGGKFVVHFVLGYSHSPVVIEGARDQIDLVVELHS